MRRNTVLLVLDETLAGDELDRVTRFLNDIAAVSPIHSISGLIRHVEQIVPPVSVPMLHGAPMLWRCPPKYEGIRRVVVAWPDAATGQALLSAAAKLAEVWNVPFCVLSAGGQRHQQGVEADVQAASEQTALPKCDVLTCDRLEDIAKCVNSDDLLVMGAYGRWWPWRLFSASHTETILQNLNCPALLLPGQTQGASGSADAGLWFASSQPRKEAANACAPR